MKINNRLTMNAARLASATDRAISLTAQGFQPRQSACYRITAADDAKRAKVYVYDVIGGWDLDASSFVRDVHQLDADAIDLHVNSPGGLVFDAVSMFEALAAHPATVDAHVDGLAASAASFLAMAADSVDIAKAGRFMIHDAQGLAYGPAADLREYADLLDAVSDDIAQVYADHAGGKQTDWRTAMLATTWYSSADAVKAGLADRVMRSVGSDDSGDAEDQASQLIRARARVTLGKG